MYQVGVGFVRLVCTALRCALNEGVVGFVHVNVFDVCVDVSVICSDTGVYSLSFFPIAYVRCCQVRINYTK